MLAILSFLQLGLFVLFGALIAFEILKFLVRNSIPIPPCSGHKWHYREDGELACKHCLKTFAQVLNDQ